MESNEMFCRDCGQVILRRAEICPKCGCRQSSHEDAKLTRPQLPFGLGGDDRQSQALKLWVGNFFWPGLGNVLIGDGRGWGYGFLTWLFVVITGVTGGIGGVALIVWYFVVSQKGQAYLSQPLVAGDGKVRKQTSGVQST
jgi:hypothetical protein